MAAWKATLHALIVTRRAHSALYAFSTQKFGIVKIHQDRVDFEVLQQLAFDFSSIIHFFIICS